MRSVTESARKRPKFIHSSARDVIAAVNTAVATHGTKTITVLGHSLGKFPVMLRRIELLNATPRCCYLPHRRSLFKDQRAGQYRQVLRIRNASCELYFSGAPPPGLTSPCLPLGRKPRVCRSHRQQFGLLRPHHKPQGSGSDHPRKVLRVPPPIWGSPH